jgi:alpha-tubulin suppressor-like RCC1 family protein
VECIEKSFKPEKVQKIPKVKKVALGDTHSLILTADGNLMTTGSNDKYQLGLNPEKRDMKLFEFN